MKSATLFVAAISLVAVTAAQPRKRHEHGAQHLHKKDALVVVETVVAVAPVAHEVYVYVDDDGKVLSSETQSVTATASFYTLAAVTPTPEIAAAAVPPTSTPVTTSAAAPAVAAAKAPAAAAPAAAAPVAGGHGYAYSPYNADHSCKTGDQVMIDFADFAPTCSKIRSYGVDCDTIGTLYPAVKKYNLKWIAGIFSLGDVAGQIATIAAVVNGVGGGDWSVFEMITITNELVDSHQSDVGSVLAAVGEAKAILRAAGYTGLVASVDTLAATVLNPALCNGNDVCAVNCHPFFDSTTSASGAGNTLSRSIATLRSSLANPNQRIIITESGWPHQGSANGAAIPSPENMSVAVSAILGAVPDAIILSAYDTLWKTSNAAQFNAEQFWGNRGTCPSER